ncbi:MAG: LysE family translocator [Chloroflexi bacterium]|nr:LysE family translocator [Chloroflexota bacterium]
MIDTSQLILFVGAAFVLLITPGPAVLFIMARSIDQGRAAGIASVLGIEVASLVHVTAAAFGLSAVLMSSALAFDVVKYLGAAYLIYLGLHKLLTKEERSAEQTAVAQPRSRLFYQGFLVNLFNPKTALFFFAFLPQFVDRSQGSVTLQILMLGMIFMGMAVCSDSLYALLAGTLGNWLRGNLKFLRGVRYFSGGMYIVLGLAAAFAGPKKN